MFITNWNFLFFSFFRRFPSFSLPSFVSHIFKYLSTPYAFCLNETSFHHIFLSCSTLFHVTGTRSFLLFFSLLVHRDRKRNKTQIFFLFSSSCAFTFISIDNFSFVCYIFSVALYARITSRWYTLNELRFSFLSAVYWWCRSFRLR